MYGFTRRANGRDVTFTDRKKLSLRSFNAAPRQLARE